MTKIYTSKATVVLMVMLLLLTACKDNDIAEESNTDPVQEETEIENSSEKTTEWQDQYSTWLSSIEHLLSDYKPYFLPEIKEGNYEFVYEINEDAISYSIFKKDAFAVLDQNDHTGHVHTMHDNLFSFKKSHEQYDFFQSICDDYGINPNNVTENDGVYTYDNMMTKYKLDNGYMLYLISSDPNYVLMYEDVLKSVSQFDFTNFKMVSISVARLTNGSTVNVYFEDAEYRYELFFRDFLGSNILEY